MSKFLHFVFQDRITRIGSSKLLLRFIIHVFLNSSGSIIVTFRTIQYLRDKKGLLSTLTRKLFLAKYAFLQDKYNVSLPPETKVGAGVLFPHRFPVVINGASIIGDNCTIHPNVLIGRHRLKEGAPIIGNNVFIGNGAKIIGNPKVGDWVFISPAAVITKDIPARSIVGAGVNNILPGDALKHVQAYL